MDSTKEFTYLTEAFPPVASKQIPIPKNGAGEIMGEKKSGMIQNRYPEGFCFAAEEALAPGTQIKASIPAEQSEFQATVKWCSKVEDEYHIGVVRTARRPLPIMDFTKRGFASLKAF